MNVSTYRSKSSNWVRVTLVTLLLILGLVIGILLGGTSSRSNAGSTPAPSVVSTPPSVELVAPLGSSSTGSGGSTGSSGDSDTSEPVPEPEPEPEPDPDPDPDSDPVRPDDLAPNPRPSLTRIRWDPTIWRRIPIPESHTTLDSRLAEQQHVR